MSQFKAYIMNADENGKLTSQGVETISHEQLPEANTTIQVEYSGLNYKDGLVIDGNKGKLARKFPHVPGIDLAGTITESTDPKYKQGDKVVLTGWRVGEAHWGGYSQFAKTNADFLVPLPKSMTTKQAMAVGTAGFTAMLAIDKLEQQGMNKSQGEVLVTGAAGGVGSVAISILSALGYEVVASSGRPELHDYLKSLGASRIIDRAELSETSERPLESETWAGCVDSVGGTTLSRLLGQMKYGAGVAACGLAGGPAITSTVIPFLLRGVNLFGIDSVMQPYANRIRIWERIEKELPMDKLESTITETSLEDLETNAKAILKGDIKGRTVVNLNL